MTINIIKIAMNPTQYKNTMNGNSNKYAKSVDYETLNLALTQK